MEIYLETETLLEIESNLSPPSYFQKHNTKTHSHMHVQRKVNQDLGTVYLLENIFIFGKWFFWKINYCKVNYFLIFKSIIKNKLKNNFQYLVMLWKISWKK